MNIVFMGTPDFAVPSLQTLLREGYNVVGVVTQPDRPKGRKRELAPTPVKAEALQHGIPVLQPLKLRTPAAVAELAALQPDLIVTAAYGQILPKSVLALPRHGCINVHASLLPKYRGGAPIHHAVMNGETVTGVTIMYMAEGLDTGDMISRVELPITPDDTTGSLFEKLSLEGAELLKRTLPALLAGELQAEPQRNEDATYASNISREDEQIRWERPALELFNQIRGLNPFPGAFTTYDGANFKVWASLRPGQSEPRQAADEGVEPGTVLRMTDAGIEVQTGAGTLRLTRVQPAGKKAMDVSELRRGMTIPPGAVFGGSLDGAEGASE
ncbi:methionyl-tRNA formyltransferase [Paenibacillus koleovorans]|uniref:methionyl-tRNA formyltransferase n=1 Tax=Paenibacillus koleovorans TaxID=121608 RepID=UPI000FDA54B3|nr:methionyl-tRNA formyltransferase [Paenibacillus koleovorans]